MALKDNIASYFRFDESSGNAADAHGSNTLTNANTTPYVAGKIGNAADLEVGSTHYFSNNSALAITGNLSISAWIKPESIGTQMYIAGRQTDSSNRGYSFYVTAGGKLQMVINQDASGGTQSSSIGNTTLVAGTMYHVVATFNTSNSKVELYLNSVNDVATYASQAATSINNNSGPFTVGTLFNPAATLPFDGLIDELGVWTRVLTAGEAAQLYNGGTGLTYPFGINNGGYNGRITLGPGTTLSTSSVTVSGSDLYGVVAIQTPAASVINSVTWGGVALTQIGVFNQARGAANKNYVYAGKNIVTGVITVNMNASTTCVVHYSWYTDVGGTDTATPVTGGSTSTNQAMTITPVADRAWVVAYVSAWDTSGNGVNAGSNTAKRGSDTDDNNIFDSNAAVTPAAATTINATQSASEPFTYLVFAITPVAAASGPANLKSYNTNVKANIKSINTNLIANVKSLNTNV